MSFFSMRRLMGVVLAGGVLVLAAGTFLAALGLVGWVDAVLLVVGAAVVAGLAFTVVKVHRLGGQLSRSEQRLQQVVESGSADAAERMLAAAGELRLEAAALGRRMGELEGVGRTDFRQLEALADLREFLRPRAPMPETRGWAASPDVLRELVGVVAARRPKLVVECGSGASSLWLGYALERMGEGRLVALEHDERYAELTRDLVRAHGLEGVVEVRYAPLRPWPEPSAAESWYDTEALDDLGEIGLLFVDGPPKGTNSWARYPAVPALLPRCRDDVVIVLDDSDRADEQEISDRWLVEHPYLERTERAFEKGAHVFTRRA